jgi:hypothetical protein
MQPLPSAFMTYCSSWLNAFARYPRPCCCSWGRRCGRISGWSPHFNVKRRFDALILTCIFARGICSAEHFVANCGKTCFSIFQLWKFAPLSILCQLWQIQLFNFHYEKKYNCTYILFVLSIYLGRNTSNASYGLVRLPLTHTGIIILIMTCS